MYALIPVHIVIAVEIDTLIRQLGTCTVSSLAQGSVKNVPSFLIGNEDHVEVDMIRQGSILGEQRQKLNTDVHCNKLSSVNSADNECFLSCRSLRGPHYRNMVLFVAGGLPVNW